MVPFDQISLTDSQLALLRECVTSNRKDIPKSDDVRFLASVGLLIVNERNTGYGVSLPTGLYRVSSQARAYLQYLDNRVEQMRNERTEKDAYKLENRIYLEEQARKNRKHDFLVASIGAVIGSIATFIVERIPKIVALLAEVFGVG